MRVCVANNGGGGRQAALATSPALIADFLREVNILRHLRHPNIIGFMGMCYRAPSDLCIVTELATGR